MVGLKMGLILATSIRAKQNANECKRDIRYDLFSLSMLASNLQKADVKKKNQTSR